MNKNPMPFYPIVAALEEVLNSTEDIMTLIELINKDQFVVMRNQIVSVFEIGEFPPFVGKFGSEVEFGDISDGVRGITFALYDQNTAMDKPISQEERKVWCGKIIATIDMAAKGCY